MTTETGDHGADRGPYEAVRVHPDGRSRSTLSRMALTGREQGYRGLVVRGSERGGIDGTERAALAETYGIDVVDAVSVRADSPGSASGAVGNQRSKRTLVLVRGASVAMNRFAVENPQVDVLTAPMAGDGDVNHVTMNAAVTNGVRIEFDFGAVLRASGGRRTRAIASLRKLRELVGKYEVPYVVSGGSETHLELRAPRELIAVGEAIGFSAGAVRKGLSEWGRLAARNRDRQAASFIEPGVRVQRDE